MSEKNQILIDVKLDEQKVPEQIWWTASGADSANETKAFFLSLFDPKNRDTLKIDLWTKEMSIPDMEVFMHNTLKAMGRSYAKAVGDSEAIEKFDHFADALIKSKKE